MSKQPKSLPKDPEIEAALRIMEERMDTPSNREEYIKTHLGLDPWVLGVACVNAATEGISLTGKEPTALLTTHLTMFELGFVIAEARAQGEIAELKAELAELDPS